jgi:hypothetical protein
MNHKSDHYFSGNTYDLFGGLLTKTTGFGNSCTLNYIKNPTSIQLSAKTAKGHFVQFLHTDLYNHYGQYLFFCQD